MVVIKENFRIKKEIFIEKIHSDDREAARIDNTQRLKEKQAQDAQKK